MVSLDGKEYNHIIERRVNMINNYNKNPTPNGLKIRLTLK